MGYVSFREGSTPLTFTKPHHSQQTARNSSSTHNPGCYYWQNSGMTCRSVEAIFPRHQSSYSEIMMKGCSITSKTHRSFGFGFITILSFGEPGFLNITYYWQLCHLLKIHPMRKKRARLPSSQAMRSIHQKKNHGTESQRTPRTK